ncbi:Octaprenyl diphosphate synthase / Dimethylallyltransferase / (2E,6E)-farnesyl diphosphate synthase / Geranylgeranyl diphosphate synthase [invertebrate metagenome]|uniref:Octaprenyl diphosphate synthase / Dimethylallyltransferase / (2E,6E)-farnesyl diphosphate synthase / Geranylgeranyl diphosphate synthase n=1 Tax=invertebrate metagenome TaxID=1711999 RepID=A0A484H797_9ZZZZ
MTDLAEAMAEVAARIDAELDQLLPAGEVPEGRLFDAMRYAVLAGGKRLRPFLVMMTARLFRVAETSALRVAAAVEMLHTYTLIHDDLPAMDNDDLRRGVPTCHRQFDEATAILAGDALLTRTFEILADSDTHSDPAVRSELVLEIARAVGANGTVGGQMIDLLAETTPMDMIAITRLQQLKTGRLISFSCEAGAILGKAPRPLRSHLLAYAHDLGLAFQIRDDVLDIEGNVNEMGKAVCKDHSHGKATFVSLLGMERARAQAAMLVGQAITHLDVFDGEADLLRQVARFVVERRC